MFEDPLYGTVWTLVYILVFAILLGIVAFVIYFWRLSRKRDKEKGSSLNRGSME